uniref:Integrase catalytic domain-containing protein n=1 Tax=Fagus sylvatica TaxID=28930 RepID=A0A2N9EWV2_FAGSY
MLILDYEAHHWDKTLLFPLSLLLWSQVVEVVVILGVVSAATVEVVVSVVVLWGSGRTGGRGDRKCDHCGGTSHTEPYCWVKYGKPDYVHQVIDSAPQTQSTSTSSGHATSSSGSCDALTTQLSELIQQLHSTLPSSSIATLVDSCHVVGVVHSSPSWVIDSGTNKHIFGILSLFSDLFPIKHHIVLADGSSRLVLGKGVLHPTKSLSLPSILFVPDSPFNLLSASQLTKALNCCITFDPTLCAFQDLKTKKMIGSGHEKNGLYYLDTNKSVFSTFLALSATVSPLQWHFRLGHPSLAKLKSAIPALSHVPSLECEACQLGKHHTSCPRTFQQNGVVERKYRHLLDVARTLLFHMHVPKHFWGDAVLTACCLINRMPSVFLNNKSPFPLLYPDCAPFLLTPRLFGCVAFVHVLDHGRDKLSPQARKCIFLGYSRTQKGYRCFSPESRQYFVSADVTFFESTPFFSSFGQCLSSDLIVSREGERSQDRCIVSYSPDATSSLSEVLAPLSSLPKTDDLPIALRKGKRTCTQHPIAHFLSYNHVSPCLHSFACTMSSISIPSSYKQDSSSSGWKHAMDEEMSALQESNLGAHCSSFWETNGYTQTYGVNYLETFSPVARLNSVRILHSVAEEVYMDQTLGYVVTGNEHLVCRLRKALYGLKQSPRAWFDGFSAVVLGYGFQCSTYDHSVFVRHSSTCIVVLIVYVDNIIISGSDSTVARSSQGLYLSQRKYFLDLLSETGLLGARPANTPMDSIVKIDGEQGELFSDVRRYRRLVGKLIYLTVTCFDITYVVLVMLIGLVVVLVTWRSKKQNVVARSSAEAEYRAMAHIASEMLWVHSLLCDLGIDVPTPMQMFCDNQAAIFIANNPVFHERTKHIEVDYHFIRDLLTQKQIAIPYVRSDDQLDDILTKPLARAFFQRMSFKLGMFDMYAPA